MAHPIKRLNAWLEKHIEIAEGFVTVLLPTFGLGLLFGSHVIHDPFWSEFGKEIGFACLVAFFIKLINEFFLSKKLQITFEQQRKALEEDVLSAIFQKIIPEEVFNEIKKTVFGDLKFMRKEFELILEFEETSENKIIMTTYTTFKITNIFDKDTVYPLIWGTGKDDAFDKEILDLSYRFDAGKEEKIPIEISKLDTDDRFGYSHFRIEKEIPFRRSNKELEVKAVSKTRYKDPGIKKDELRHFFASPTANLTVRVRRAPPNFKFSIFAFGSEEFEDIANSAPDTKIYRYKGCFYANQGFILSWTR